MAQQYGHYYQLPCLLKSICASPIALPDVPLLDEDARVVDGPGQPQLEHLGLKTPLKEVLHFQRQHVIKLHLGLVQHANAHQSSKEGVTLEQPSRVPLLQSQQLSRRLSDLSQCKLYAPHLPLVLQAILPDKL